jgi:hypothetical protein
MIKKAFAPRRPIQGVEVPGYFRYLVLAAIGFALLLLPRHGEKRNG